MSLRPDCIGTCFPLNLPAGVPIISGLVSDTNQGGGLNLAEQGKADIPLDTGSGSILAFHGPDGFDL